MYRIICIWVGKAVAVFAKMRGGGSALPGLIVEKMYPNFLLSIKPGLRKVVLVTGTNGKTTTTKMLNEILRCRYKTVIHNEEGSNMSRGIASSVLQAADWRGRLDVEVGLFEVDEGYVAKVAGMLKPDSLLILNLHRDQLDRYGEMDRILEIMADASKHAKNTVVNYDDSKLFKLAQKISGVSGVSAAKDVRRKVPSDDVLYSEAGEEDLEEKNGEVHISGVKTGADFQSVEIKIGERVLSFELRVPGVFNTYNAALALAASLDIGIEPADAAKALGKVTPAFGRSEVVEVGGKTIQLLLVKNPSGFNQVISSFLQPNPQTTLIAINDNYADGRDVSWLWDVNIESMTGKRGIIASGTRAYDMALRLKYAEMESVVEADIEQALERLISSVPEGGKGYIVPTYTAMLSIRKLLKRYVKIENWR